MGCSGQIYSVKGPHGRAHTYTQETARQVSIREACQPSTLSSQYLSLFQKVAFLLDWSDVLPSTSLTLPIVLARQVIIQHRFAQKLKGG